MTCDDILDKEIFRVLHKEVVRELIDRINFEVPDTFVPSAKEFAVADDNLLYLAHPMGTYGTSRGWVGREREGLFWTLGAGIYVLSVRRYETTRYGEMWGIERELRGEKIHEVLGLANRPIPIFHCHPMLAKAVAKHCHPNPREEAQCLRWIPIAA